MKKTASQRLKERVNGNWTLDWTDHALTRLGERFKGACKPDKINFSDGSAKVVRLEGCNKQKFVANLYENGKTYYLVLAFPDQNSPKRSLSVVTVMEDSGKSRNAIKDLF